MSGPEVQAAVRDYLRHTGGSEVEQLWNGLRREATASEIRGALKKLGAVAWRSCNPWDCLKQNIETSCYGRPIFVARRFTVYKLAQ